MRAKVASNHRQHSHLPLTGRRAVSHLGLLFFSIMNDIEENKKETDWYIDDAIALIGSRERNTNLAISGT